MLHWSMRYVARYFNLYELLFSLNNFLIMLVELLIMFVN
jgi:hypothetical protein